MQKYTLTEIVVRITLSSETVTTFLCIKRIRTHTKKIIAKTRVAHTNMLVLWIVVYYTTGILIHRKGILCLYGIRYTIVSPT